MSNNLDPDQVRCFVKPDLGPNCKGDLSVAFLRHLIEYTLKMGL